MPQGHITIQTAPSKLPENIKTFLISGFDPEKLDDLKVRQIHGAIDCFKIIHTCLKGYFNGQTHMYKPISAQLRILFCDFRRKKDYSLIARIHPEIKMIVLKKPEYKQIPETSISVASAPYVIKSYHDGIIDANFDFEPLFNYISLEKWRDQIVDLYPIIKLSEIIRSIADKDGGAHLDDVDSPKLKIMRGGNPTKVGSNILFIIALAHHIIDFANQIVPVWKENKSIKV